MSNRHEYFWNQAMRNAFARSKDDGDSDIVPPTVTPARDIIANAMLNYPPDYDGTFCQNVRTRNRTSYDACIGDDVKLDSAMRDRYAIFGIDLRKDVGIPHVSDNSMDSCLSKEIDARNCCYTQFDSAAVFDDIATEAVVNSYLPPDKQQRSLKTDRIKIMMDSLDYRNPRARGHERKHFHADYLLVNAVYYYAQLYKKVFPKASAWEVSQQTQKWYNENNRGELLRNEALLVQLELDCNEQAYNLGYVCYPIDKALDRFFDKAFGNIHAEVQRR